MPETMQTALTAAAVLAFFALALAMDNLAKFIFP